jgi:hypothetical protein
MEFLLFINIFTSAIKISVIRDHAPYFSSGGFPNRNPASATAIYDNPLSAFWTPQLPWGTIARGEPVIKAKRSQIILKAASRG